MWCLGSIASADFFRSVKDHSQYAATTTDTASTNRSDGDSSVGWQANSFSKW